MKFQIIFALAAVCVAKSRYTGANTSLTEEDEKMLCFSFKYSFKSILAQAIEKESWNKFSFKNLQCTESTYQQLKNAPTLFVQNNTIEGWLINIGTPVKSIETIPLLCDAMEIVWTAEERMSESEDKDEFGFLREHSVVENGIPKCKW